MGTNDEVEVVPAEELPHDVATKGEGNAAVVLAPPGDRRVGIGPEDVAQQAGVGNVAGTGDVGNLLHLAELGAEAAVHADDLVVDDGAAGEAVEGVAEGLPKLDREAAAALVVEAVDAVDAGALVVAAEDKEVLGILDFVGKEEAHDLEGLLATVDVVAEEEVVGLGGEAAVLKQTEEVGVLSMDVTANFDGSAELEEHGLTEQHLPTLVAQGRGILDGDLDGRARLLVSGRQERIDDAIDPGFIRGTRVGILARRLADHIHIGVYVFFVVPK